MPIDPPIKPRPMIVSLPISRPPWRISYRSLRRTSPSDLAFVIRGFENRRLPHLFGVRPAGDEAYGAFTGTRVLRELFASALVGVQSVCRMSPSPGFLRMGKT